MITLNDKEQQQLEKIIEHAKSFSQEALRDFVGETEQNIRNIDVQIQKYQQRIDELTNQKNFTSEQIREFVFSTGTGPITGQKAERQIAERENKIETLENHKQVMNAWLERVSFDEIFEKEEIEEDVEIEEGENYWAEYYKKLDACNTTEEANALRGDRYYEEERKLYAEHGATPPERNDKRRV